MPKKQARKPSDLILDISCFSRFEIRYSKFLYVVYLPTKTEKARANTRVSGADALADRTKGLGEPARQRTEATFCKQKIVIFNFSPFGGSPAGRQGSIFNQTTNFSLKIVRRRRIRPLADKLIIENSSACFPNPIGFTPLILS
jgi:hypothetical protein